MTYASYPFSEAQMDAIEEVLFDPDVTEESTDLFGIHGMVCACIVGPVSSELENLSGIILGLGVTRSESAFETIDSAVSLCAEYFGRQLNEEQPIQLPTEIYDDEVALQNWCSGFLEVFLLHEKAWFTEQDEAKVAALLLPIMAHSELFDDEDFEDIRKDDKLMAQMVSEISDNLLDLFLLYRT